MSGRCRRQATSFGRGLRASLNDVYLIDMAIGLLSAIVDNVPLVAASMGMYDVVPAAAVTDAWTGMFVQDGIFWQFLAYCAGTGGSALIIGSAAGVAVMGLERIDFVWYLKKISLLAILGYFAGAGSTCSCLPDFRGVDRAL